MGGGPTKTKTGRRVIVLVKIIWRESLERKSRVRKLCCNFPLCRKSFHVRRWSKHQM
jgi:hypothetical protein